MAEVNVAADIPPHDKPSAAKAENLTATNGTLQSDSMTSALARLKDKISRLELDRRAAESDMRKLAEETSLFREQMQVLERERERSWRPLLLPSATTSPPPPPPSLSRSSLPAAQAASQGSIGPRHFEMCETEDEFFVLPEATMVAEVTADDAREVSNTLDIVENRCFALEREFQLMREVLEDADRNSVLSRELLRSRNCSPPPTDVRSKRRLADRERLNGQLLALLGPSPEPPRPRLVSAASDSRVGPEARRKRPKAPPSSPRPVSYEDVVGNVRPRSAAPKARKPQPRTDDRGKVRALLSDLHIELEGLKEEHRLLANRLASESNRAQKALLVRDLERVVRHMEQKGEQMGRLRTYVRRGGRFVVRPKEPEATPKERQLRTRKAPPTLAVGDVRWTSAP